MTDDDRSYYAGKVMHALATTIQMHDGRVFKRFDLTPPQSEALVEIIDEMIEDALSDRGAATGLIREGKASYGWRE